MFGSLYTYLDCVVVRESVSVNEVNFSDGWGENEDFIHVFRHLNFKSYGEFMGDQSMQGSYNYVRMYKVSEDILAMMESMRNLHYCRHGKEGDEDILNWKEIFNLIFDDDTYNDLLLVITHVKAFTLRLLMTRFANILGYEIWRTLPYEAWECILIHTLRERNGGRTFQIPTVTVLQSAKKQELEKLSKLVTSMGHIHVLLSRIAFFGNYVCSGNEEEVMNMSRKIPSCKVTHHFHWMKLVMKRNFCQLLCHISEDTFMYMPSNAVDNITSVWKGSAMTSAYAATVCPETVCFAQGVSSLVALVGSENCWDPQDRRYGTITVCNLENSRIVSRIKIDVGMVTTAWRGSSYHLSHDQLVFVDLEQDAGHNAAIFQWKFAVAESNQEKFVPDLKWQFGGDLSLSSRGFLGFIEIDGSKMISICAHRNNGGVRSSELIFVNSISGQTCMSFQYENCQFEIVGMKKDKIILSDKGHRDVVFCHIAFGGLLSWRRRYFQEEHYSDRLLVKFDAHPQERKYAVLTLQGSHGVTYELFQYDNPHGCKPFIIMKGTFPIMFTEMSARSSELLNGCMYLLREQFTLSYCHCFQKRGIVGYDLVILNCSDGTIHAIDHFSGNEIWVSETPDVTPCTNEDCLGRRLIDPGNGPISLQFSNERGRDLHFVTNNKLLVNSNCVNLEVEGRSDFVEVTFL